jgi:hypothetical protein
MGFDFTRKLTMYLGRHNKVQTALLAVVVATTIVFGTPVAYGQQDHIGTSSIEDRQHQLSSMQNTLSSRLHVLREEARHRVYSIKHTQSPNVGHEDEPYPSEDSPSEGSSPRY